MAHELLRQEQDKHLCFKQKIDHISWMDFVLIHSFDTPAIATKNSQCKLFLLGETTVCFVFFPFKLVYQNELKFFKITQ